MMDKIIEIKSGVFQNIDKIDKSLARFTKNKRQRLN